MAASPPKPDAPPDDDPRAAVHGTRSWRATALTGVSLLGLVTVHMIAHHFVVEQVGGLRTYRQVLEYIGNPMILGVEAVFLVVVTWHAMLGLRSVLFDFGLSPRARLLVGRGLTALGILTVAYGMVLLLVLAARA